MTPQELKFYAKQLEEAWQQGKQEGKQELLDDLMPYLKKLMKGIEEYPGLIDIKKTHNLK